jgi:hypothetical protein
MKISDVIRELQKLQNQYGDLECLIPVSSYDGDSFETVENVKAFFAYANWPHDTTLEKIPYAVEITP